LKKLNLAKVRSATGRHFRTAALLGLTLAVLAPASAAAKTVVGPPRVIVAVVPNGTEPAELGAVRGISPGLMSAGLARVGAEQTYLDISQGNRIFNGFYDEDLPFLLPFDGRVPHWDEVLRRADSAPADIVPGLLASTLAGASPSVAARVQRDLLTPALIAVDRRGRFGQRRSFCGIRSDCPPGLTVEGAYVGELRGLIERLRVGDMLIALERPPPRSHHGLALGIAGSGFDGNLTSDSTRLRGMVLATDVAPTILRRFGVEAPKQMLGRPIRSAGGVDPGQLAALDARLSRVVPRRGPVIGTNVLIWLLAAVAVGLLDRRRRRQVAALLAVTTVYMPALLLAGAAIEPPRMAERLIVGLGAPLLAALTLRLAPGYRAYAVASGATVGAYALDLVAGLGLTPLSLMGPNPALGVRFYGIGNELEATLAALVVLGTGAALASLPVGPPRRRAATFLAVAALATVVFAAGRFGADVGAAIVLPVGAAAAAVYTLGLRGRRLVALVIAAPLVGLLALIGLDLVAGGDSHLSRSVLHAGGSHDLADIASRRLRSAAGSFARPIDSPFLVLAVGGFIAAFFLRRHVAAWFAGREPALAGLLGALAATLVGVLANDSGALILIIGTGWVASYACFAWSQSRG
jgi:hypothetical protein